MKCYLGFSIFELLLVVALIIVMAVIIVPSYRGFARNNDLIMAVSIVGQGLSQAQSLAISGEEGSDWGVRIQDRKVIIFKGNNFAERDTSADEFFMLPANVRASGLAEVVFVKFTGLPKRTGQITFWGISGSVKKIIINEQGTVFY